MDKTKLEKIQRFLADKTMAAAVQEVLLNSFLTERANQDVYVLAASRLSIDFFKQGWKDLEKLRRKEDAETKGVDNVGL